jgi:hypothetical protein
VEIEKWYRELTAMCADVPDEDHERMAAALAEQKRISKEFARRQMGLPEETIK